MEKSSSDGAEQMLMIEPEIEIEIRKIYEKIVKTSEAAREKGIGEWGGAQMWNESQYLKFVYIEMDQRQQGRHLKT